MIKITGLDFNSLPSDERVRLEMLMDLFGEILFELQDMVASSCSEMLSKPGEATRRLGRLRGEVYEVTQNWPIETRRILMKIVENALGSFSELLVGYLDHTGNDLQMDSKHVARFKLTMEVYEIESDRLVFETDLNRSNEVFFSSRWGKWFRHYHERRKLSQAADNASPAQ